MHYMALVEGLFAHRAVEDLSQETEAELAEVHDTLWRRMTEAEHGAAELLIEEVKERWKGGRPRVMWITDEIRQSLSDEVLDEYGF